MYTVILLKEENSFPVVFHKGIQYKIRLNDFSEIVGKLVGPYIFPKQKVVDRGGVLISFIIMQSVFPDCPFPLA